MPELVFVIRWPDGEEERCWSPSTVLAEHLTAGETYPLADFLARARTALRRASDRVEALHGHRCAHAESQLAAIETRAARFADEGQIACLSIAPLNGGRNQGRIR